MKFLVSKTSIWGDEETCFEKEKWFMEIPTLDDLLGFIEKHGRVIIRRPFSNDEYWKIEIYNTSRK